MDVPYKTQLSVKEQWVREVVGPFQPRTFLPILPSPDIDYYRNKMEFAFGGPKHGPVLLGLREKKKFNHVVNVSECFLMSPETVCLLDVVRHWAEKERLPTYHLRAHKGFLRYLVLREGKNTGQRMVHLITAEGMLPEASFLEALDSSQVPVDTVLWSRHTGLSDVAQGGQTKILKGAGVIEEKLGSLSFQIGAASFFQTNTKGAEVLYQVVSDFAGHSIDTLIDFYCGAGAIGLFCAPRVKKLMGVEIHAESVRHARENAKRQGVMQAVFFDQDADAFAKSPELLSVWQSPGTVSVMDPPRPGLQPAVRQLLIRHPIEKWIYVSCNPKALSQDLAFLAPVYEVEMVQPVDMFPHTPHVEVCVLLKYAGAGQARTGQSGYLTG